MTSKGVYLRANVLAEPLFNNWYAWSGLIPPATAAMYIANSHLKIMQSFVTAPQVHVSALKNPKMLGGPFINYDESKAGEVRRLLDRTIKEQEEMIRLADAIKGLSEALTGETGGMSLEPLYERVPAALKGYVELVYDFNDHPSFRLIEGLLYKSKYYRPASQALSLSLLEKDNRSFVFSTPRLESDAHLHLAIPFSDSRLDELFKMKMNAREYGEIKEILEIEEAYDSLFSTLFTEQTPHPVEPYQGEGVRVRYFGHACVLIETKGVTILTDPVISYEIADGVARYSYRDLPQRIDYVLITHSHQDHCMFETLLQLRHKVANIVIPRNNPGSLADSSLKLVLKNIGFNNVIELEELESLAVAGGEIVSLPFLGEHADLNIRTKSAYMVNIAGKKLVFAADSNNIAPDMYDHIHEVFEDIDVLFLGMECEGAPMTWIYGPLLTRPVSRKSDQSRRLNGSDFERGMRIVEQLNPKHVYVYAMGQEPWLTHVTAIQYTAESRPIVESNKLTEECGRRGLVSERLFGRKEIFLGPD